MAKRILAVGHDAYRAGAQIVFLHILRWMREHYDADLSLVLGVGGAIEADYEKVLPTTVLRPFPEPKRRLDSLVPPAVAHRRRERALDRRIDQLAQQPYDLVYVNSAAAAPLGTRLAARIGCPSVCHVHELEMSIRRSPGERRMREAIDVLDGYIAVSRAVEDMLVEQFDVDASKIDLVHECIPILPTPDAAAGARVLADQGIPPDAFVVGGCGTLDWRKGPDVFLLVAKAVARRHPARPIHFLWVGGEPQHLGQLEHDLERLRLDGTVGFTGSVPDPSPFFARFDTFLLSSREDPFPLVCLEAAAASVPIVCFADGGGMPEFVENDAGAVVDYLDIEAAADRIVELAADEDTRLALGRRARTKVTERCSIDVIGPQLQRVLDRHARVLH